MIDFLNWPAARRAQSCRGCWLAALLAAAVPQAAEAQQAAAEAETAPAEAQTAPAEEEPEPDPGGLNIQYPRPRLLAIATIGAGNEYRDRLLSGRSVSSLAGGVAWMGLSASASANWELSTGKSSHEVLLGYSYKLPHVDAHAGYVLCGNSRMPGGCPDGFRLTLSSNSIARTTIEASIDIPVHSKRRTLSASATRDLWNKAHSSGALRIGWTRTEYGELGHLDGASVRLIASKPLSGHLAIEVAAGAAATWGRAKPPGAGDGAFGMASLVWRY